MTEISDDKVKMDINHFLAGKTLVFDIAIAETGLDPPPPKDCGCACGTDAGDCGSDSKDCGSGCEGGCSH